MCLRHVYEEWEEKHEGENEIFNFRHVTHKNARRQYFTMIHASTCPILHRTRDGSHLLHGHAPQIE